MKDWVQVRPTENEGFPFSLFSLTFLPCPFAMPWSLPHPAPTPLLLQREQKTSLVAQTVKRLSTMWETRVQSLGWEDPLEKEMAIHSSTLAWKIPWREEPGRLRGVTKSQTRLSDFTFFHFKGKMI